LIILRIKVPSNQAERFEQAVCSARKLSAASSQRSSTFPLLIKHQTRKVRRDMDAMEVAQQELLRDLNRLTSHSKMVKLNIGGHHFSTSLETLTKDPGMF